MTRQTSDQLYIELEYFTPEEYYVYIANSVSLHSSQFSIECEGSIAGQILEAESNLTVVSTQTILAVKTVDAVSTQTSEFTQTATGTRIQEASAAFTSAFTPVMTVEAIKNSFAVLDATTSISIDAQANRATSVALESIVNQSLSGDRLRDYASQQTSTFTQTSNAVKSVDTSSTQSSSFFITATGSEIAQSSSIQAGTFSLTAQVNRPTRNTTYDITSTPRYTGVVIDPDIKKWGSGSLRVLEVTGSIQPTTNIVWNGTNFKAFGPGYTWTSTDGLTWTRTTNNASNVGLNKVKLVNNLYITNTLQFSSDGVTFTSGVPDFEIEYVGGFYYYSAGDNTRIYIYRSSTINGSYTTVGNFGAAGFTNSRGSTNNGSTVAFVYTRNTDGAGVVYYGSGTSWSANATVNATNDFATPQIKFGGGTYVATFTSGLIRKSTNLTTWTTVSAPNASYIRSIEYKNSNWILNDYGAVYSGSTIDNLALRYTFNPQDAFNGFDYGDSKYIAYHKQSALYSSNLTSWSLNDIESIENAPGYVEYSRGDNTDFNNWGTIDFWVYSNNNALQRLFEQPLNNAEIRNYFVSLGNNFLSFAGPNNTSLSSGSGNISNGWNHIRITRSGSNISLYTNGVRRSTASTYSTISSNYPIRFFGQWGTGEYYIDEFLITEDVLTAPSSTSYIVPTGEFTNTANTDLLLHFNGNFEDDSDLPKTYSVGATLSSTFTQTADVERSVRGFEANFNSLSSIDISAIAVITISSDVSSQFTLTAEVEELPEQGVAELNAEFTQTVNIDVIKQSAVALSSEFTQTALTTRIQEGAANFDAVASQLTAAAKVGDFLIACDVVASQTAAAVKTTDAISTQSAEFTQTAEGIKAVNAVGELTSEFAQTVDGSKFLGTSSDLSSTADLSAVIGIIFPLQADLESQAQLSADPAGSTVGFAADLTSEFAQTTVGLRIKQTEDFVISSEFTQTTSAIRVRFAASSQNSQADVLAIPTRVFDSGVVEFDAVASQLAAVAKIGDFLIAADVISTLNADIRVIAAGVTALDAEFAQIANAVKNAVSSADVSSEFTQITVAIKAVNATGDFTSEFALTADAVKSTDAIVLKAGEFTQTAHAVKTASANSDLEAFAFKLSVGDRTRDTSAALSGEFDQSTVASKITGAEINISSAFTPVMNVNIIHIVDAWTYKIKRENRQFNIKKETRSYKIKEA